MRLAPSADLRCRAVERFGLDPREGPCAADMTWPAKPCALPWALPWALPRSAVGPLLGAGLQVAVANRGRAGHGRRGRALLPMHVAGCNVACTMAAPLLLVRFSWSGAEWREIQRDFFCLSGL